MQERTEYTLDLDPRVLGDVLDGRWADERRIGRRIVDDERTRFPELGTLEEMREATKTAILALVDTDMSTKALPKALGGQEEHGGYVAAFEEALTASPSMQIKAGVQFGLFAGAIQHLGNPEQHEKWLLDAAHAKLLGSFAMTEIGHGSDVASIGTTATYDPETEEFVIDTPFRAATKEYLGNAARHAEAAVVFAQLITKGVNHGVHAFLVPVRDGAAGSPLPGISFEDDGKKGGLLGVDNGRIAFDGVRVPRTNLLNRYGDVAADGTYSSDIESPGRRFFTMLGTLVQGRVSLDGAAVVASKLALDIAVRYGLERRQFVSSSPTEETVLMDYQRHQRRLMPLLAETYANAFAHEELLASFDRVFGGDDTPETREILETQAAGYKATTTWAALDILQEAREACGGAGFMAENRLVGLRADLDVYVTFEGDNTVLLQLVGKRLLQDYAEDLADIDFGGAARLVGSVAAEHALFRTGIANVGRTIGDLVTAPVAQRRVRSGHVQEALLSDRVDSMVADIAQSLRAAKRMKPAEAAALFNSKQNQLVEASIAYVELQKWRALNDAMHRVEEASPKSAEAKAMRRLRDLFGLTLVERHMGWHLMYGRLPMARARLIPSTIDSLCAKVAGNAAEFVAAFGYGPEHRRATIAEGAEKERQDEAREYYRRGRAQADWPIDEKELRRREQRS